MSNIQDITSHSPEENSVYFLDCVVLLYLFHPQGDYNRNITAEYSRLYGQIIKKNKIIYNRTLVSELINRYLRLGYDYYIKEHNLQIDTYSFKYNYKDTLDYKNNLNNIIYIISENFKNFTYTESSNLFDINNLLNQYTDPKYFDFNDADYINLAKEHNAIIVTHDSDFMYIKEDIQIITANTHMFK